MDDDIDYLGSQTALESYGYVFANPFQFLWVSAIWMGAIATFDYYFETIIGEFAIWALSNGIEMPLVQGLAAAIALAPTLIGTLCMIVAWHNYVVSGALPIIPLPLPGLRAWAYVGRAILAILIPIAALVALAVGWRALREAGHVEQSASINTLVAAVGTILAIVLVYIFIARTSLALVSTAIGGKVGFARSWALTKGKVATLALGFFIVGLSAIPARMLERISEYISERSDGELPVYLVVASVVADFLAIAIVATFMSLTYLKFTRPDEPVAGYSSGE